MYVSSVMTILLLTYWGKMNNVGFYRQERLSPAMIDHITRMRMNGQNTINTHRFARKWIKGMVLDELLKINTNLYSFKISPPISQC